MSQEQPPDDESWAPEVRERWKTAHQTALANVEAIQARIGDARAIEYETRLSNILASRQNPKTRLRALYRLIAEHTADVKGNVACRAGCSHCCHIGVPLNPVEARMIGDVIGRDPRDVGRGPPTFDQYGALEGVEWGYHNPCTFLRDGMCSIYEHRPLTCRVHFNMDRDELLCKFTGSTHQVPYMDLTQYRFAYVMIGGVGLADIREYFPREELPRAPESVEQNVQTENGQRTAQEEARGEGETQ
jgi:Fe-S-cluster containining protein